MPRKETLIATGRRFVADENTVRRYGLGASVLWTAFTDAKYGTTPNRVIKAGTAVEVNGAGLIIPATGNASTRAYLTAADALEREEQGGAQGQVGLIVAAQVYENLLPDADGSGNLAAGVKTALAANGVTFQKYPTTGFVPS